MNTGNKVVDEITQLKFEGNIIPNTWYCHIKRTPDTANKKNKRKTPEYRTDILAINILSDIIYWYRASETRDENSGKTIGYKKKFKSNKYQKWYSAWMDMFGVTKRQIQLAMKTLIDLNLLEREVKNITTEQGLKLTGVTYFEPVPRNIKYINIPVSEKHLPIYQVMTPLQNSKGVVTKLSGGYDKIVTHTDNTTENTTETPSAKAKFSQHRKTHKDSDAHTNSQSYTNPDIDSDTNAEANVLSDIVPDTYPDTDTYPTDTDTESYSNSNSNSKSETNGTEDREIFVAEPDSLKKSYSDEELDAMLDPEFFKAYNSMSAKETNLLHARQWNRFKEIDLNNEPPKINRKILRNEKNKVSLSRSEYDKFQEAQKNKFNGDIDVVAEYIEHEIKMWEGSDRIIKGDKRLLLFQKEYYTNHEIFQHFLNMTPEQRQRERDLQVQ